MKAVVFTGMPWSGKSEAVDIARAKGFGVVRMGDFVWSEVKKRELLLNPDTVGKVASEMREKYGNDIWAKRTVEHILEKDTQSVVIIDGARSIDEIKFFKNVFKDDFVLVAIVASESVRHERALKRERKDDSKDIMDIRKRDNREISWGVDKVIEAADVVFENNGELDDFLRKIEEFLLDLPKR
jgi:dephospho-CoA kinase